MSAYDSLLVCDLFFVVSPLKKKSANQLKETITCDLGEGSLIVNNKLASGDQADRMVDEYPAG